MKKKSTKKFKIFFKLKNRGCKFVDSYPLQIVLLFSILIRYGYLMFFFKKVGYYSAFSSENWYWFGFFNGYYSGPNYISPFDPMTFFSKVIQFFGGIEYPTFLFLTTGISIILIVIVFLIANEHFGSRVGIASALIFASLRQPMAFGTISVIHDLTTIPIFIIGFLFVYEGLVGTRKAKIFSILATIYIVGIYFYGHGFFRNVFVFFALISILIFYHLIQNRKFDKLILKSFILLPLILLTITPLMESLSSLGFSFISEIPTPLELINQFRTFLGIQSVSPMMWGDISPSTLISYLSKYLVTFIVFLFAFKRILSPQHKIAYCLCAFGFWISLLVERATRYSDIGIAIVVGEYIVNHPSWSPKIEKFISRRGLDIEKSLPFVTSSCFCIVSIFYIFFYIRGTPGLNFLLFLLAVCCLLILIVLRKNLRTFFGRSSWFLISILLFSNVYAFSINIDPNVIIRSGSLDADYYAFSELEGATGWILIPRDRVHLARLNNDLKAKETNFANFLLSPDVVAENLLRVYGNDVYIIFSPKEAIVDYYSSEDIYLVRGYYFNGVVDGETFEQSLLFQMIRNPRIIPGFDVVARFYDERIPVIYIYGNTKFLDFYEIFIFKINPEVFELDE